MGWSGKVIGGALGSVFAGPLGAAVGAGIGHLFDRTDEEPSDLPVTIDGLSWTRCMGPSGPGMLVMLQASPARRIPEDAQVQVWLQYDEETYAEAELDAYADDDGALCVVGGFVERDKGSARAVMYLPWAAVPAVKGDWMCQVSIAIGDLVLGNQLFEVTLPNRATREVHSAMGALAYAAAAMIQQSREVSESCVYAATRLMTGYFELDEVGQELIGSLFERAAKKRPDFEKALRLVQNEIEPENHALVVEFLGEVGRAAGAFTRGDEAFIEKLAAALGIAKGSQEQRPNTSEDPVTRSYRALELEPGAGLEQVRAAYRRLALDYHPDKVETLAVGFREYATARMQAINEAYQVLKSHLDGK